MSLARAHIQEIKSALIKHQKFFDTPIEGFIEVFLNTPRQALNTGYCHMDFIFLERRLRACSIEEHKKCIINYDKIKNKQQKSDAELIYLGMVDQFLNNDLHSAIHYYQQAYKQNNNITALHLVNVAFAILSARAGHLEDQKKQNIYYEEHFAAQKFARDTAKYPVTFELWFLIELPYLYEKAIESLDNIEEERNRRKTAILNNSENLPDDITFQTNLVETEFRDKLFAFTKDTLNKLRKYGTVMAPHLYKDANNTKNDEKNTEAANQNKISNDNAIEEFDNPLNKSEKNINEEYERVMAALDSYAVLQGWQEILQWRARDTYLKALLKNDVQQIAKVIRFLIPSIVAGDPAAVYALIAPKQVHEDLNFCFFCIRYLMRSANVEILANVIKILFSMYEKHKQGPLAKQIIINIKKFLDVLSTKFFPPPDPMTNITRDSIINPVFKNEIIARYDELNKPSNAVAPAAAGAPTAADANTDVKMTDATANIPNPNVSSRQKEPADLHLYESKMSKTPNKLRGVSVEKILWGQPFYQTVNHELSLSYSNRAARDECYKKLSPVIDDLGKVIPAITAKCVDDSDFHKYSILLFANNKDGENPVEVNKKLWQSQMWRDVESGLQEAELNDPDKTEASGKRKHAPIACEEPPRKKR